MPYKYIGRTTDFKGKTLWEILGNLKNLGVGRIIGRNMFQRYPEPSYIKVLKVEAEFNPKNPSNDVSTFINLKFKSIISKILNLSLLRLELQKSDCSVRKGISWHEK